MEEEAGGEDVGVIHDPIVMVLCAECVAVEVLDVMIALDACSAWWWNAFCASARLAGWWKTVPECIE